MLAVFGLGPTLITRSVQQTGWMWWLSMDFRSLCEQLSCWRTQCLKSVLSSISYFFKNTHYFDKGFLRFRPNRLCGGLSVQFLCPSSLTDTVWAPLRIWACSKAAARSASRAKAASRISLCSRADCERGKGCVFKDNMR